MTSHGLSRCVVQKCGRSSVNMVVRLCGSALPPLFSYKDKGLLKLE